MVPRTVPEAAGPHRPMSSRSPPSATLLLQGLRPVLSAMGSLRDLPTSDQEVAGPTVRGSADLVSLLRSSLRWILISSISALVS